VSPIAALATGPRAHSVRGDGVALSAREYGNPGERTVLMVHGFPDCQDLWTPIASALAQRFHVITYDLRGAGASGTPPGRRPYAFEHLAADARAVIDALGGGGPVHLVGHDWGAIQGWEFLYAEATRTRIASFVCVSGACFDHVGLLWRSRLATGSARDALAVAGQLRRSWYMLALQMPWLFRPLWRHALAPRWGRMLRGLEGIPAQEGFPAASIARDGANLCRLYWRTPLERLLAPVRREPVNVPVTVVRPERDRFLSPQTLEGIERYAPRVQVCTVPGGHWAPRAQPERLGELIAGHVERATARG
jgi:pimeloyl-ACP methyl ester carboxylesterase